MIKTEELNSLFEQWRSNNKEYENNFAPDGIVNEDQWNKAKKKILVILKETNEYNKDIRELINRHPWREIGRWSYGIQSLYTTPTLIPDYDKADENFAEFCRMTAVINLKKSSGKQVADYTEVSKCAEMDKAFIKSEIMIISPDIVICGGTFEICTKIFLQPKKIKERLYEITEFGNLLWIDYIHIVQYNVRRDMMYYTLMVHYQKYLQGNIH
jgi:hypothetical protein